MAIGFEKIFKSRRKSLSTELHSLSKTRVKHPFLLLEVLIAFMLIVLCILPLLSPHVAIYKEQKNFINQIELNNRVNLLYVDILEKMHKGEIRIADIINKRSFSIPLSPTLDATYILSISKEKKRNEEGFNVHLANLDIELKPKTSGKAIQYHYLIFFASQFGQTNEPEEEDSENEDGI